MTTSLVTGPPRVEDQDLLDRAIAEQGGRGRPGALLSILEKLQEQHRNKYLPMETLEYVAARTGIPQALVMSVATFYALFNLEPQGLHTVSICRGTACHTRGSRALLERLKLQRHPELATGPMMNPWERVRRFFGRPPSAVVDTSGLPLSPAAGVAAGERGASAHPSKRA